MKDVLGAGGNLDPKSITFENSEEAIFRLFCRCVESEEIMADRPWTSALITDANIRNGFDEYTTWAIDNDNLALFIYSQKRPKHEISAKPTAALLIRCASRGKTRIAELFINAGTCSRDDMDRAVIAAARGGHLDVVERLLIAKADVNAAGTGLYSRTALQAAAEGGHLDVVEILLIAKADVNAAGTDLYSRTALQAAVGRGHGLVIERLKKAGAK